MTRYIEMVCAGNSGRSPVMELLGRKILQERGVTKYDTTSSGTMVDRLRMNLLTTEEMTPTVTLALQRSVYTPKERKDLAGLLKSKEGDLAPYFVKAMPTLIEEEHSYRTRYLVESCFDPNEVKKERQTKVRSRLIALVTPDISNKEKVNRIYTISRSNPIIATVSELAEKPEVTLALKDRFDYEFYKQMLDQITARLPAAMDEVLRRREQ